MHRHSAAAQSLAAVDLSEMGREGGFDCPTEMVPSHGYCSYLTGRPATVVPDKAAVSWFRVSGHTTITAIFMLQGVGFECTWRCLLHWPLPMPTLPAHHQHDQLTLNKMSWHQVIYSCFNQPAQFVNLVTLLFVTAIMLKLVVASHVILHHGTEACLFLEKVKFLS